jgi:hypothetical protein
MIGTEPRNGSRSIPCKQPAINRIEQMGRKMELSAFGCLNKRPIGNPGQDRLDSACDLPYCKNLEFGRSHPLLLAPVRIRYRIVDGNARNFG